MAWRGKSPWRRDGTINIAATVRYCDQCLALPMGIYAFMFKPALTDDQMDEVTYELTELGANLMTINWASRYQCFVSTGGVDIHLIPLDDS